MVKILAASRPSQLIQDLLGPVDRPLEGRQLIAVLLP
jgi:hypothetical protein